MRNSTCLGVLSAALSCGLFLSTVSASTITITGTAEFETDQTATTGNTHGGSNTGSGTAQINYDRVGERTTGSPGTEVSMDIPFLLPTIPAGASIDAATLEVSTVSQSANKPVANADLYGITTLTAAPPDGNPIANPGTVSNTPYYFSGTGDTNGVTLLESNFLDPTNGATAHNFTSSDFTSFIQGLYAADPNAAGMYVTLRLSYDSTTFQPAQRYEVLTSQGTGNPEPGAVAPTLSIDVTPEPGAISLLAISAMALIRRRRTRGIMKD